MKMNMFIILRKCVFQVLWDVQLTKVSCRETYIIFFFDELRFTWIFCMFYSRLFSVPDRYLYIPVAYRKGIIMLVLQTWIYWKFPSKFAMILYRKFFGLVTSHTGNYIIKFKICLYMSERQENIDWIHFFIKGKVLSRWTYIHTYIYSYICIFIAYLFNGFFKT